MSPVKPAKKRSPRSVAIGVGFFALGTVLVLALFILAIPKLSQSGKIEVKLGSDTFAAGPARSLVDAAREQPLLFSDVANGQRDIFLVHTGDDPLKGWVAFDAHKPGKGRECSLQWDKASASFRDPCDGTTVPVDGAGLPHYPAAVDADGIVIIDLNAERRGTTTTSSAPPTPTSSSIVVTGSTPK